MAKHSQEPEALPSVRYNELPDVVIKDFLLKMFKKEIQDNYVIDEIFWSSVNRRWTLKLNQKIVRPNQSHGGD